jgi:four helix bundle protein
VPGWKDVDDVIAYRLAVGLRDEILRLTASGGAARDWAFRDQIRDSARSAPRNLAEGFYRYNHKEFAYFANVARGSLGETICHIRDGGVQGYFAAEDVNRLLASSHAALRTITGLLRHLRTSNAPMPYWMPRPDPANRSRK